MNSKGKLARDGSLKFRLIQQQEYHETVDPILARKWIEPKRCETKHNALCEICQKFFPNHIGSLLHCIYCNVICHVECMLKFQKRLVPTKEWICFYCIDFLDESKKTHKTKQSENLNQANYAKAQIILAKYWRRYMTVSVLKCKLATYLHCCNRTGICVEAPISRCTI